MIINWNTHHINSLLICHCSFASVTGLKDGIRESKTVDFLVRHSTKTSLDIEISSPGAPEHNFTVAHIPPGAERFKFLRQTVRNIFDGSESVHERFKLTKTQGLPELKEYLSLVLAALVPDAGELDANITLFRMPEFAESQ